MSPSDAEFTALSAALRRLSPFTDYELALLRSGVHTNHLEKRDCFVKAGKYSREVGFVYAGAVRYYYLKDGTEVTNYFCLEGDWVGAYTSFLRQTPSNLYIEALEDTRLLTFSYDQLRAWEAIPDLAYRVNHFCRRLAEYYIGCYDDRVASFVLQTPEERYLAFRASGHWQRIPQQYIANYLGVTPVSLSRIRKRVQG